MEQYKSRNQGQRVRKTESARWFCDTFVCRLVASDGESTRFRSSAALTKRKTTRRRAHQPHFWPSNYSQWVSVRVSLGFQVTASFGLTGGGPFQDKNPEETSGIGEILHSSKKRCYWHKRSTALTFTAAHYFWWMRLLRLRRSLRWIQQLFGRFLQSSAPLLARQVPSGLSFKSTPQDEANAAIF